MRVLIEGAWRDEELPQDVGRAKLTADSATVSRRTARRVRMIEQTQRPSRILSRSLTEGAGIAQSDLIDLHRHVDTDRTGGQTCP